MYVVCKRNKLACHRVCLVHESGWHNAGWSKRFCISNSRATHVRGKSSGIAALWLHRTESSSCCSRNLRLWATAFNRSEPFLLGLMVWNQGRVFSFASAQSWEHCSAEVVMICLLPSLGQLFHRKYLMGIPWLCCFEWVLLLSRHLESSLMAEHYIPLVIGANIPNSC